MFKLRRIYLDSVGVTQNRFADLTIELTDTSGQPADSLVLLSNGSGKTSLLSLLLALIRPARRDFLAHKTKNRTLEDLILSDDTAHVVAEWVSPDGDLLLTGAVYEWDGRIRPSDYNDKGKDRLRRSWWCIRPDPDVEGATLDSLPFYLRTNGGYDRDKFCNHIQRLAMQGVDAVVVNNTIAEWHAALRERRFDPGLFEYFLVVNAAEGGIDGLFDDIDSPGKFVRYLLKFVGNHERIGPVRDLLKDTAAEIAKRPLYLAEREFCDDAQQHIKALGDARADRDFAAAMAEEERLLAAHYKHALQQGSAAATDRASQAGVQLRVINEALTEVRSEIDMLHSRNLHYLLKAAEFALTSAQEAVGRAKSAAVLAKLTVDGWQAVEQHLELQTRRAELSTATAALEEKTQAAQPLRDKLHGARAELAAALSRELERAAQKIAELGTQIAVYDTTLETADATMEAALKRRSELETEQQTIHSAIAKFDRQKLTLIERGVLNPDETLAGAEQRLTEALGEARNNVERLQVQLADAEQERDTAAEQLDHDREAVSAATVAHSQHEAQLRALDSKAAKLGNTPRLRILMQSADIDLTHEAADAQALVEQAKAEAQRQLFELNESIAAGERALHALQTDELLPPRVQVQQVVDELTAAGITAVSGWKYLAEHIAPAEHPAIISHQAAIIDGVIVYRDDLAKVATHIRNPVEEMVVLAHVSVFDKPGAPQHILGPAPAQHDRSAAAEELTLRTASRTQLTQRRDQTDQQHRDDDRLLSNLRAFIDDTPADGFDGLRSRVHVAETDLHAAREHETTTKARRDAANQRIKQLTADLQTQRTRAEKANAAIPHLGDLATTEAEDIVPSRRRLQQIPGELSTADGQLAAGRESRDQAARAKTDLLLHSRQLEQQRIEWRAELEPLPEPLPTELPLPAARRAVDTLEETLHRQFPEDALRFAVDHAQSELRKAHRQWDTHPEPVQQRALALAATADAAEPASRQAARTRAADAASAAERSRGESDTNLAAAQRLHETARRNLESRRSRKDTDLLDPVDRADADMLAAEAAAAESACEARRWSLEQDLNSTETTKATQQARAQMLDDQAAVLHNVEPVAGTSITLPDDAEHVRTDVATRRRDLDSAEDILQTAEQDFDLSADQLSQWAGNDKFVHVADDEHGHAVKRLREMLRDKASIKRVAESAPTLVDDLGLRSTQIVAQLRQVDETKANIAAKMTDLVAEALTILRRASVLSELPEGVGAWDHHPFLDVAPRSQPTREQITLRVGDLIDRIVNGRTVDQVTDPAELLWRATEAAVHEGFKATILKPTPDQSTARTPVAEMRKWSGGENLTASLVLFCVFARLRAEQRTLDKATSGGGVLPLDNPVGKANYLPFLELQRKVARANGVQLVYLTGIGDLGAVTTFPRIAAMHKRPSKGRADRAFVTVDDDKSRRTLDIVSAVRNDP